MPMGLWLYAWEFAWEYEWEFEQWLCAAPLPGQVRGFHPLTLLACSAVVRVPAGIGWSDSPRPADLY